VNKQMLLTVDACINFVLGVLLLLSIPFSSQLTGLLGVPEIENAFYPSLLGAVLFGIGIALVGERARAGRDAPGGLGLAGAIAINLCGGLVLGGWLVLGKLDLPPRGWVFLWVLDVLLVGVSGLEWVALARSAARAGRSRSGG